MKELNNGRKWNLRVILGGIGTAVIAFLLIYFFTHPSVSGIGLREGAAAVSRKKILYVLILAAGGLLITWTPCRLSQKNRRSHRLRLLYTGSGFRQGL